MLICNKYKITYNYKLYFCHVDKNGNYNFTLFLVNFKILSIFRDQIFY